MMQIRGRTGAEPGLILGHEITGVVDKVGPDVETLKAGDIVSSFCFFLFKHSLIT